VIKRRAGKEIIRNNVLVEVELKCFILLKVRNKNNPELKSDNNLH
jgi:hypothetical protein